MEKEPATVLIVSDAERQTIMDALRYHARATGDGAAFELLFRLMIQAQRDDPCPSRRSNFHGD